MFDLNGDGRTTPGEYGRGVALFDMMMEDEEDSGGEDPKMSPGCFRGCLVGFVVLFLLFWLLLSYPYFT